MDKLPVFISWSGERSLKVAKHLKQWLRDVLPNAEPWLSQEDLRKGLQWLPELNKNLAGTAFGLLVLTADNKDAPWLVFEAGVISKALPDKHCCPLLCDLKPTDVSGPLAQFQATTITKKEDMLQLLKAMNDASGEGKFDDERINKWFSKNWDEFESQVKQALAAKEPKPSAGTRQSTDRELLEEMLSTVRQLALDPRGREQETPDPARTPRLSAAKTALRDMDWQRCLFLIGSDDEDNHRQLLSMPASCIPISDKTRAILRTLGVTTIGELVRLAGGSGMASYLPKTAAEDIALSLTHLGLLPEKDPEK